MGSTAPKDLTSDKVNNWNAGKNKDLVATKGGIKNNVLTDFVGIAVFSGSLRKI